jgi:hypothetical protein
MSQTTPAPKRGHSPLLCELFADLPIVVNPSDLPGLASPGDSRLARNYGYFLSWLGIISQEYTLPPSYMIGRFTLANSILRLTGWLRSRV